MTTIQIAIDGRPLNRIEEAQLIDRLIDTATRSLGPGRSVTTSGAKRTWLQQLWAAHFVRSSWDTPIS